MRGIQAPGGLPGTSSGDGSAAGRQLEMRIAAMEEQEPHGVILGERTTIGTGAAI